MDFDVTKVVTVPKGGAVWIHDTIATEKMASAHPIGTKCYNTNIWGINGYYSESDIGSEVFDLLSRIVLKARLTKGMSPRAISAREECIELLKKILELKPSTAIRFVGAETTVELVTPEEPKEKEKEEAKKEMKKVLSSLTREDKIKAVFVIQKAINFFTPAFGQDSASIRMYSKLCTMNDESEIKKYCSDYLKLSGNEAAEILIEQMESDEFKNIVKGFIELPAPKSKVNNRLSIYYGPPGTGKTYTTLIEHPGCKCMVCSPTMDPSDLIEVFDFTDEKGLPVFKLSPLGEGMVEGGLVCLDEINLLSRECCTVLQGYLDNKNKITSLRGREITIKKGFEVIGTMNLNVDGQIFALPTPLVDRCKEIKEFILTVEQLVDLIYKED